MDYAKTDRADALAAAYVAGSLKGPARRRLETLLPSHPRLRAAVHAWEARLIPLSAFVPPVQPRAETWAAVEQRLNLTSMNAPHAALEPVRKVSRWWQAWTGFATAGLVILAVQRLVSAPEAEPQLPVVVVMAPSGAEGDPLAAQARFVASVSADGRGLVLRPVERLSVAAERSLELWAVPAQGAPRSLGLIDQARGTTVLKAQLLDNTAAFAVSIEPKGGSPTGAPTGTVISVGKLES
jgi:anti-sigma-K factor RskA